MPATRSPSGAVIDRDPLLVAGGGDHEHARRAQPLDLVRELRARRAGAEHDPRRQLVEAENLHRATVARAPSDLSTGRPAGALPTLARLRHDARDLRGLAVDVHSAVVTLLVIAVIAVVAPIAIALLPGPRIPQVVVLLLGGMLIGPQGLRIGSPESVADPGRRRARLPVPPGRLRGRPAAPARGPRTARGGVVADERRTGRRRRRAAVRRRARPGVRPGRHRADDHGAGHPPADPARARTSWAAASARTSSPAGAVGECCRSSRWPCSSVRRTAGSR